MAKADAVEEAWLGRDNVSEWVVMDDNVPVTDLSGTTQAKVFVGTDVIDSAVDGSDVLWWTDSVTSITLPDGQSYTGDVLRARLGRGDLTVGEYEDCRIVLYDMDNTNGLVVSDNVIVTVYVSKEA